VLKWLLIVAINGQFTECNKEAKPMKNIKMISPKQVGRKVRAQFLAGILVVVPVIIAILILVWLFNYIDNLAQPVAKSLLGRTIPGLGFAIVSLSLHKH